MTEQQANLLRIIADNVRNVPAPIVKAVLELNFSMFGVSAEEAAAISPLGNYFYDSALLRAYAAAQQKINWIKEFRENTRISLKESKEEYERRYEASTAKRVRLTVRTDEGYIRFYPAD